MIGLLEDLLHCDDKREAIRRTFCVEKVDLAHVVSRKRFALRYLAEAQSKRDSALKAFGALGDSILKSGLKCRIGCISAVG